MLITDEKPSRPAYKGSWNIDGTHEPWTSRSSKQTMFPDQKSMDLRWLRPDISTYALRDLHIIRKIWAKGMTSMHE